MADRNKDSVFNSAVGMQPSRNASGLSCLWPCLLLLLLVILIGGLLWYYVHNSAQLNPHITDI